MPRRVTIVDVDAELLARARDAMSSSLPAEPGAPDVDVEVIEGALRFYLGVRALDASQAMSDLDEDDAIRTSYDELRALRRERSDAA